MYIFLKGERQCTHIKFLLATLVRYFYSGKGYKEIVIRLRDFDDVIKRYKLYTNIILLYHTVGE